MMGNGAIDEGFLEFTPSVLSILDCVFTTKTFPPGVTSELVFTFVGALPISSDPSLPPIEPELHELRRLGCSEEILETVQLRKIHYNQNNKKGQ